MSALYFFVDLFIKTFGITAPTEKRRKQAAFFILILLVLSLCAALVTAFVIRGVMR